VKGSGFKKTDFALALLTREPESWIVPAYITNGLKWLENAITPPDAPVSILAQAAAVAAPAPQEVGQ
jgi:hypothetical protein